MSDIKIIKRNNLILYYLGDITLLDQDIIAVIGKREISMGDYESAKHTGKFLAENSHVVLNGLALGCDKAALEGVMAGYCSRGSLDIK